MKARPARRGSAWALGGALAALLVACSGETNPTRTIEPGRIVADRGEVIWDAPTRERLGVRMPGTAASGGMGSMGAGSVAPAVDPDRPSPIAWETPSGWTEVAPTSMRIANFQAGDPAVQCYVTILTGDGGGMLANVNRWRDQMGQPPIDAVALDAMERVPQLGTDAVLVEVDAGEDGLIGTVSLHGTRSVFVKMTGPSELVFAEKARFLVLCGSLSFQE